MKKRSRRVGTRVGSIRDGLAATFVVGRLSFLWSSATCRRARTPAATSAYFMLSVIPTALVAIAFFDQSGGNTDALRSA